MVLQEAASAAYLVVQSSWNLSTFLVPVFLAAETARSYLTERLEEFEETAVGDSVPFVIATVFLGASTRAAGIEIPEANVFGSLIALAFYGYLFWRF
ncbi:MAG: hypothetical protein ABEJ03_04755 [Candidatus Nanohaloarchaea archaeon]